MEVQEATPAVSAPAAAPSGAAPLPMEGILLLEQPFARSPYDELRRQLRAQQRLFEREFQFCHASLSALGSPPAAAAATTSQADPNAMQESPDPSGSVAGTSAGAGAATSRAASGSMDAVVASKSPRKKAGATSSSGTSSSKKRLSTGGSVSTRDVVGAASEKLRAAAASASAAPVTAAVDASMDEDASMSFDVPGTADASLLDAPPPAAVGSSGPASSFGASTPAAGSQSHATDRERAGASHAHQQLQNRLLQQSDPAQLRADAEAAAASIGTLLTRLRGLKRKLSPLSSQMAHSTAQAQARITHLDKLHSVPSVHSPAYEQFARTRLDRMLSDYMLRKGYAGTAKALSERRSAATASAFAGGPAAGARGSASARDGGGGAEDFAMLVDDDIFKEIERIERTLQPGTAGAGAGGARPTCAAALAWCAENKAALKKIKSPLEFELRMQEFIELARARTPESLQEAIVYARKHLLPFCAAPAPPPAAAGAAGEAAGSKAKAAAEEATEEYELSLYLKSSVFRAMGLLACKPGGWLYEDLYNDGRWQALCASFRACALEIHSLPPMPTIHIALSAGLSTLKLPACYSSAPAADAAEQANGAANGKSASTGAGASSAPAVPAFPPAAGLIVDDSEDDDGDDAPLSAARAAASALTTAAAAAEPPGASTQLPPDASGVAAIGVTAAAAAAANAPGSRPLAVGAGAGAGSATSARSSPLPAQGAHAHAHEHGHAAAHKALDTSRNVNCPVCDARGLGVLAKEVPWSHHANSTLICRIQGSVMNEDDPPLVLPNGRVYSASALAALAIKNGDMTVTCPATGETFPLARTRKIYIS